MDMFALPEPDYRDHSWAVALQLSTIRCTSVMHILVNPDAARERDTNQGRDKHPARGHAAKRSLMMTANICHELKRNCIEVVTGTASYMKLSVAFISDGTTL